MIRVLGDIPRTIIDRAVQKIRTITDIPRHVDIYFADEPRQCRNIEIPKKAEKGFSKLCDNNKISFFYHYGKKRIVVIYIGKDSKYLFKNEKALIGLILHELMHSRQSTRKLYEKLSRNFMDVFTKRLRDSNYTEMQQDILIKVGLNSTLFLKDLYVNSELIRHGFGDYLLENYTQEFASRKAHKPIFHKHMQEDLKKDKSLLPLMLQFQFALLSILTPFEKFNTKKSSDLKRYIARYYAASIRKVYNECKDIRKMIFRKSSESTGFQKKFFNMIFDKVVNLLE